MELKTIKPKLTPIKWIHNNVCNEICSLRLRSTIKRDTIWTIIFAHACVYQLPTYHRMAVSFVLYMCYVLHSLHFNYSFEIFLNSINFNFVVFTFRTETLSNLHWSGLLLNSKCLNELKLNYNWKLKRPKRNSIFGKLHLYHRNIVRCLVHISAHLNYYSD